MPLDVGRMSGDLLLADISGYTKFLTGTELEHSHAIVTERIKLIRSRLVPPMRVREARRRRGLLLRRGRRIP